MADLGIGTAFPGSPAKGDWFTRSDLGGVQFVYTANGWVAEQPNEDVQIRVDEFAGIHVSIAAAKATDTVLKAAPGVLKRMEITAVGTNAPQVFDNAAAGSGDILGTLPASAAVGTIEDFEMPAAAGITLKGSATNPALTISFE